MAKMSLEDLRKLRENTQQQIKTRDMEGKQIQIIVGMGTCGIAAGAREVMKAVLDELAKRKINNVSVLQTGCIGMCQKEPLLDIVRPGEDRVTYGPVKPTDVPRIIADHLVNGIIVDDLVVAKLPNKK